MRELASNGARSPLRGAIVGFGFIAEHGHVPATIDNPDVQIVAVADVKEERRHRARAVIPGVRVHASAEALFSAEAGELDFIDIATPPCDHAPLAHAALDRGLHVLCEKPIAASGEAAAAMLDHARRVERVVFPVHNYKDAPVVKSVRALLDQRRIGRVGLVTVATFRPTHARGVEAFRPDWRRERRYSGGGVAMDHGSHAFYLIFDWLGGYPAEIAASAIRLGPWDTEDNFACTMSFPDGIATAQLSWTAGCRKVIYTIHGERGAIRVEDDELELTERNAGGAPVVTLRDTIASAWSDASHARWFASVLGRFRAAIDARTFAGREAEDALACVRTICAGYTSSALTGARVAIAASPRPRAMVGST